MIPNKLIYHSEYLEEVADWPLIQTLADNCCKGCSFHVAEARVKVVKTVEEIHRQDLDNLMKAFFGSTIEDEVTTYGDQIKSSFPKLIAWL